MTCTASSLLYDVLSRLPLPGEIIYTSDPYGREAGYGVPPPESPVGKAQHQTEEETAAYADHKSVQNSYDEVYPEVKNINLKTDKVQQNLQDHFQNERDSG